MQCFDSLYICMIKIIEGAELQYEMDHDGDQLQHDQFPLRAGEDR